MMKITASFAVLILGLCVSVQGQTRRPDLQAICRRQNDRCLSNQVRNGRTNEVTNIFNNHCRASIRGWRNVTRCELARANCNLTLVSCSPLTCANVRRTLGTGTGGPTTPRIPTPRTPSPNPDPDTDTTTRGGRTPRPRTPSPPTRTPRPRTPSPPTRTPRPRTPTPPTRTPRPRTPSPPTITRRPLTPFPPTRTPRPRTTTRRTTRSRTTTRRTTTRRTPRTTTRRTPTTRGRRTTTPRIPATSRAPVDD